MLIASLLGIAAVDAINPSALAMTTYLLSRPNPWAAVRAYIAGIFTTYLAVGLVVVFMLGSVVDRLVGLLATTGVSAAIQGFVGAVIMYFALRRRRRRTPTPEGDVAAATSTPRAFLLGVTITAAEAITALPYFGALALVIRDGPGPWATIGLLVVYNVVFVTPPIAVALAARYARLDGLADLATRVRTTYRSNATLQRTARSAAALVGLMLVVDAGWDVVGAVEATASWDHRAPRCSAILIS